MRTSEESILAKLVAFPTIYDNSVASRRALDYVARFLETRGMHLRRFSLGGNEALVAATRITNFKKPAVLLAAHVDVVSGPNQLFTLRREGNRLKGRGVYDMKFALAGYMQLVDNLADQLADYDFAIMVTSDEELANRTGTNGTRSLVEMGYRPEVCVLPDSAAPGWEIEAIAKGSWRFYLDAYGKTAHGSRPWEGDSAAFHLIDALTELKAHFAGQGPDTDTINIGIISGGDAINQVPGHMRAAVEIRLMQDDSLVRNRLLVGAICEKYKVKTETTMEKAPLRSDFNNPRVQRFADSVERVTGKRPKGSVSFGGSDAIFFHEVGIPYIVSCPSGGGHHSDEEWVDRDSFLQFVPILQDYLDHNARLL